MNAVPTFTDSTTAGRNNLRRDLLDTSVYSNDARTAAFHEMFRAAAHTAASAASTPFHHFMAQLARERRLLRLYTQNIDDLDTRLAPLETARPLPHSAPWPKTIQLHGSLGIAVCATCHTTTILEPSLFQGPSAPDCQTCKESETVPKVSGRYMLRSRGVGRLRPRITLYNERAFDSEAIGQVMAHDLRQRPDAVVVVGTSLRIPDVKKFVKDACAVVRQRRNGLTAWINLNAAPADVKGLFDIQCQIASDTVAGFGLP